MSSSLDALTLKAWEAVSIEKCQTFCLTLRTVALGSGVNGGYDMTDKHTPGPWTLSGDGSCVAEIGNLIVTAPPEVHDWKNPNTIDADARLIAAAPDLLEALKPFAAFIKVLETMGGSTPRSGVYQAITSKSGTAEITVEDFAAARTAIAKATGAE